MHALIQTDAEISEVLMRALIHDRVGVIARGWRRAAHRLPRVRGNATIKQFLTRNGHPFKYSIWPGRRCTAMLDRFHVEPAEIPVGSAAARWC